VQPEHQEDPHLEQDVSTEIQEVAGPAAAMYRARSTSSATGNLDANFYGHCWGTYELTIPELGGRWEGTWGGPQDLLTGASVLSAVDTDMAVNSRVSRSENNWHIGGTAAGTGGTVIVRVTTK